MKLENKLNKLIFALPFIFLLPIILQGCSQVSPVNGGGNFPFPGQQNKANVVGLDINFVNAPTILKSGREFRVALQIENYGEATSGEICLEDSADDIYGGISQDCQAFSISGATEENKKILVAKEQVSFPSQFSAYRYERLSDQPISLVAITKYNYRTNAKEVLCIKDPNKDAVLPCASTEILVPRIKAPLIVSRIEKNLFRLGDGQVEVSVNINLKKNIQGTLSLPGGFGENAENKIQVSSVNFGPYNLACETDSGVLEIKTEKVLSCSGIIFTGNEVIKHPLEINIDYDVKISKTLNLKIDKI